MVAEGDRKGWGCRTKPSLWPGCATAFRLRCHPSQAITAAGPHIGRGRAATNHRPTSGTPAGRSRLPPLPRPHLHQRRGHAAPR